MLRIALIGLTLSTLAQVLPGCPTSTPDPQVVDRGRIETSASSSAPPSTSVGVEVELRASADGDDVSYSWLQTAGPGVQIRDANSRIARFTAPSLADSKTLRFQVTTRNAGGDVGSAEVKVIVAADPNFGQSGNLFGGGTSGSVLIARAGTDKSAEEGSTVQLSGLGSSGPIVAFAWRQTAGTGVILSAPNAATTSFTAPAFLTASPNRLEFELTVRDAGGLNSRDRVAVTVTEANDPDGGGNNGDKPRVRVVTTMGDFVIELDRERAPNTVQNFLDYADENFFDSTLIHRVVPGFVIQGGGFNAGLIEKTPTRPALRSEAPNGNTNVRGTVSMALRGGNPDSGTTQWFVNLVDNTFLDNQRFTVFGRVVEGISIVDTIGTVATTTRNGLQDVPVTDILITDVRREP